MKFKEIQDSDFQQSKEIVKLKKLWEKTWKTLSIKNPFCDLIDFTEFDANDYEFLIMSYCEHHYENNKNSNARTIQDIVSRYSYLGEPATKLLNYALLNFVEYINDYLTAFDIQLVNSKRQEWSIIRFASLFLGDYNNNKVTIFHERYDYESGEFVVFDKKFVEKCLSNNAFPNPPKIKPSKKYKKLAKNIFMNEKIKRESRHQETEFIVEKVIQDL